MKKSTRILWILILFNVMLTTGSVAPPSASATNDHPARLHPYLAKVAKNAPHTMVDVIVSKTHNANEDAVERASGGKKLNSWAFINAIHLRVPAKALPGLASHPGVRGISPDATVRPTAGYSSAKTANALHNSINVADFWDIGYHGHNVGVAILDSGVADHADLKDSKVNVVIQGIDDWEDFYGHGTHVAGIITGDSKDGTHIGVAPKAKLYNIKISANDGSAKESDLINGMQWVYDNRSKYNIRIANISMQSSIANDYMNSPLAAAAEQLWFGGVVVVVSAGNRGTAADAMYYPPANDPYVITVGAFDDVGTNAWSDDTVISWSSQGLTQHSYPKPDVLAPGRGLAATLAEDSFFASELASRVYAGTYGRYLRLSGSSMAAPVVAGAVALMLQYEPTLNPNQVKYAILEGQRSSLDGQVSDGPMPIDLSAVKSIIRNADKVPEANQGLTPSSYIDPSSGTIIYDDVFYSNVFYSNVFFSNVFFTE